MYGYVYETLCLVNKKRYIGMHKWNKDTIDKSYLGSGVLLKKAIKLYGKENFVCKILEWCETREKLLEREEFYISKYKAPIDEMFYNIEDGGQGGHNEYYVQPTTQSQLKALEIGRHLPSSELQKQTLSNYRKNVVVSNETREKLSIIQQNKKCINNGVINKYVKPNELDIYISQGWVYGQVAKDKTNQINKFKATHKLKTQEQLNEWKTNISNSIKGRKWITKNGKDKQVPQNELEKYLSDGWIFGRHNGGIKK